MNCCIGLTSCDIIVDGWFSCLWARESQVPSDICRTVDRSFGDRDTIGSDPVARRPECTLLSGHRRAGARDQMLRRNKTKHVCCGNFTNFRDLCVRLYNVASNRSIFGHIFFQNNHKLISWIVTVLCAVRWTVCLVVSDHAKSSHELDHEAEFKTPKEDFSLSNWT